MARSSREAAAAAARVPLPRSLLLALLCLSPLRAADGYNVDTEHVIGFSGPAGSRFGYSVLLHRHRHHTWLVVGAPEANVSSSSQVRSPGAVYKCRVTAGPSQECLPLLSEMSSCGMTCKAESDHQWLGVSLSRNHRDGRILACAHRWKNVFYSHRDKQMNKLPNGICYLYGNDLSQAQPIIPCYRDYQWTFGEDFGSCQAGMSTILTEDLMVFGAPGTSYWTGSVLVYNSSSRAMSTYMDNDSGSVKFGSYLGYSVGIGHFLHPTSTEVVGGAPQDSQTGKVFIFTVNDNMLSILAEFSGDKLGSYFGASVCVVDLNGDGLSDLLVGAPMTTSTMATGVAREEGRVHVYINQGQANMMEASFQLAGRDSFAARFGETIADLGDIDHDGYHDVAVGAPQEEDLRGAVYIYNGRRDGISQQYSQRISGADVGLDLMMFGQSLIANVDIDNNGYQDVAVGAYLSDSAVVLRTRPVVRVEATLLLPDSIDPSLLDQYSEPPAVNLSVCFTLLSAQYKGLIDLQYSLVADLLHKPTLPNRFYFHGNQTSNQTTGRVRARHNQLTCTKHMAYQRRDTRDIFTKVLFQVSYALNESSLFRGNSRSYPPLKPLLQHSVHGNSITNKTSFFRSCILANCSTNLQLTAQLEQMNESFFSLGSGRDLMLVIGVFNGGDDAFLPTLTIHLPTDVHYVKILPTEDSSAGCDVSKDANSTTVDCSISSFYLAAHAKVELRFLLGVNQNSTPGDVIISINASSDNYEHADYLHDNAVRLVLPLRYGVDISIHGFVSPTSFVFGNQETTAVDCFSESFNYTYNVLNVGPSRSVGTVVEVDLPKIVSPHLYRLLQLVDWQVSQGSCGRVEEALIEPLEDCDVPQLSFIRQLILFFFFSSTSSRTMFCSHADRLCERLVCNLGNVEQGSKVTINLEIRLNPAVLQHSPGRHSVMLVESSAFLTSPSNGDQSILLQPQALAQVVLEAHSFQKPSGSVKIFIIVVSLVLGLLILSFLIYCLWKVGFFKREFQKDEARRDSWDYVSKSTSSS
ncbi:unnamed protein product [Merluccius merluccius]